MSPGISTGWPTSRYASGIWRVARRVGARGPLAVDADPALLPVDREGLELGDVVAHVVDEVQARPIGRIPSAATSSRAPSGS